MIKKEGSSRRKKRISTVKKHAPVEHAFVTTDGKSLRSILHLARHLDSMTQETFAHHVNAERNDFTAWLHDVFSEKELAKMVQAHTDKDTVHFIILKHVVAKIK
ncbi:MAG: hypothetical protein ACI8Y7_000334 [Candidatus Woesearchaeota archaeon]|jgi:hypothetical protein